MKVPSYPVIVCLTCTLVFLLCGATFAGGQNYSAVKTIVIDPGHGGTDPGTTYGKTYEKDIVLSVSKKLGALIQKHLPDVKVIYTRETDVLIPLAKRGDIANEAKADLFISIHVDAVEKNAPSGSIVLVMGEGHYERNLDVTMRENGVVVYEDDYTTKYQGFVPNDPESYIMFSLMQYVHQEQSMRLADIIQERYKKETPIPVLGARQQPILVLWKTTMPSVLVELGFLPNDHDRKVLTSDSGQNKIAAALFNAISEYKSRVENNGRTILVEEGSAPSGSVPANAAAVSAQGPVVYMIQVCSSRTRLGHNGSVLKPHKNLGITERTVDGLYKYYVGSCSTYEEASTLQKKVREQTSDAFVVAFRGGVQIPVSEARSITDR
ncbi:MAG: N-acetylmuramoyl-L-alanine amidase [Rikenellaceae bacterium]|nr:N-acetylmuramoyl-L-alanine amidase [Rikenellaceae bacterium]